MVFVFLFMLWGFLFVCFGGWCIFGLFVLVFLFLRKIIYIYMSFHEGRNSSVVCGVSGAIWLFKQSCL